MGLISNTVTITLSGEMANYYEELGYNIPRVKKNYKTVVECGTKLEVNIKDLKCGSNVEVDVMCDCCSKIGKLQYGKYLKNTNKHNGIYLCKWDRKHKLFVGANPSADKIIKEIISFYDCNNRFPKYNEYTTHNGFSVSYSVMMSIFKENDIYLQDVLSSIDCIKSLPNIKYYDNYIERLKTIIDENSYLGKNLYMLNRASESHFGLPKVSWLIKNCPDKNVVDMESFKKYVGIFSNTLSKEECINKIIEMSETLKRPLMYDDFRGSDYGQVTISNLRDYWGSLNKMKIDLGLEIIQESMIDKQLSKEEFDNMIQSIHEYVLKDKRNFITTREIDSNYEWRNADTLRRMCEKYYNKTLSEHLLDNGISLGKQGIGINFDFEDGEHITSQFEYMFSKFLKEYGLSYNKDYFRDVKYSSFCNDYSGNMNCDYEIHINNYIIYIEIAGIIDSYKEWYYADRQITRSRSKEKYRLKLKQKEQMLRDNNYIYFILFPCDLTRDNFMSILENPTTQLRKYIESFMKNNIDWVKIREIGELKYSDKILYGRRQIDYSQVI